MEGIDLLLVKECMVKNVLTINQNDLIIDACNLYKDHKIGCLIVTENNSCIGIITERDIIERTICERINPELARVKDIMTKDVITIHSLENIEKALHIMKNNNIKKLPVVNDGNIVGIITITDISRARPDLSKRFIDTWVKPDWKD